MQCDVIFKTFRTYKHPYVYDRHTNSITMLNEDEYQGTHPSRKRMSAPRRELSCQTL